MLRLLRQTAGRWIIVTILLLGPAAGRGLAGESPGKTLTVDDLTKVLQQAGETAKTMPPASNQAAAATEQAEKTMEQFNTPAYQAKIQAERQRLRETVFHLPEMPRAEAERESAGGERLYLFISSSVPVATLRAYAATIDQAKARQVIMVLRGFVGGMKRVGPNLAFIGEILKKDPDCDQNREKCDMFQADVQVDPERCQRLHINEVPALAYVPVDSNGDEGGEPLIVSGDASLDALLERINRETKSPGLQRLLAAISGNKEQGGCQ